MPPIRARSAQWMIAAVACAAAADLHAGEIWRSDWMLSAPPTLSRTSGRTSAQAAFASNEDILFGTLSYAQSEYQFVRVGADGTLRWSANAAWSMASPESASALIATDDGGALIATSDPEFVGRIDATGHFAWLRPLPAAAMAEVGSDRVALIGCYRGLMVVDKTSGDVIWQETDANLFTCGSETLAVDDADNIYSSATDSTNYYLQKHDASGALLWSVPGTGNFTPRLVGASGGLLFVVSDELDAIETSDGSLAWSTNIGVTSAMLAGSPGEPIVVTPTSITRLSSSSGTPRWTTPLASTGSAALVGDSLLVSTSANGLARVAVADGHVVWNASLPSQDAAGDPLLFFSFGGLANGHFLAIGAPWTDSPAPPVIENVAFNDGSLSGAIDVPAVSQGPSGDSTADETGRVLGVQSAWDADGPTARVRALDGASGAQQWNATTPIDVGIFAPNLPYNVTADIGATPTAAIVAVSASSQFQNTSIGELWLASYDSTSGHPRWQAVIRDTDQGTTHASTPLADAQGDIYVDVGAAVQCAGGPDICGRRTLRKISGADGHVIWDFENDAPDYDDSYPETFAIAGTDAIVAGPFSGPLSTQSVIALSGSDGSTQWTSHVLGAGGVDNVLPSADGIFVVGAGWAKLDAASGNALWQGPAFAPSCTIGCFSYDIAKLPNDDIVMAGEADRHPLVTMLRGDGSGSYANWTLPPNDPSIRSAATIAKAGADGRLWIGLLRQAIPSGAGLFELAEIDPATGAFLSQQALRARQVDGLQPNMLFSFIGAPESNRLLLDERTVAPPAPTPSGNVLLDTTITAHGDLAVTLVLDHEVAYPGQTIAFHAHVTYTGDAPIAGAELNVYLPWSSGARDVVCAGVDACVVDTRGGNALATADLNPGDGVDVTGTTLVLYQTYVESATVGAVAIGPVGLSESDTLNNIAQQAVSESEEIFANGFDH